jgi:hypothetical protein
MTTRAEFEEQCDKLAKTLADKGMLVEAGFAAFQKFFMRPEASVGQLAHARLAFMAGAEHVFTSMMQIMDEGTEPTDDDFERMNKLHAELGRFRAELEKHMAKGRA